MIASRSNTNWVCKRRKKRKKQELERKMRSDQAKVRLRDENVIINGRLMRVIRQVRVNTGTPTALSVRRRYGQFVSRD